MQGKLYIIPADQAKPLEIVNIKAPPSAEQLHKLVGGWLEQVPLFVTYMGSQAVAFCNEDGKRLGLEPNRRATAIWYMSNPIVKINDVLCGDIAIVTGDRELMGAL